MHDRGARRAGERERPGSGSSGAERGGQDNRALVESGLNAVVQPTTIMEQGVPAGEQWRRLEPAANPRRCASSGSRLATVCMRNATDHTDRNATSEDLSPRLAGA
jgi:hypothetical protein